MSLPRFTFRDDEALPVHPLPGEEQERKVQSTANDATVCKLAAANKGYIEDPFLQYFVKIPVKKPPIINRGTAGAIRMSCNWLGANDAQPVNNGICML